MKMTKEDIENAAIKNIEFQGKLDLGSIIENSCRESFVLGANWRINSVWNDSSITPDPMQECLVLLNDPMRKGFHIGRIENQGTNNGKWNIYGYFTPSLHEFVIRWAYIEDLLPNKED